MKTLLIACDFDGTITQRDTLHVLVERFGEQGLWDELTPRLRAGEITVEQAMSEEFARVRATRDEVHEAIRLDAPVRAGFVEFARWCEESGHRLVVLSNGFRSVIARVLAEAGLGHLEVVANDARFSRDGTEILWSDRGARCTICDRPCKRQPLREHWNGERLVFIGDGISDRCASGLADIIFARDFLAAHLDEQGTPYLPFDDFHTIRATLATAVETAS